MALPVEPHRNNLTSCARWIFDQVDYTLVDGVGEAAFLATVSDRSLASQRQAVLIIKRGSDVFAFGVMDTPDALMTATALAQAVLYAQPS